MKTYLTIGCKCSSLLFKHEIINVCWFCISRKHIPRCSHLLSPKRIHWPKLYLKNDNCNMHRTIIKDHSTFDFTSRSMHIPQQQTHLLLHHAKKPYDLHMTMVLLNGPMKAKCHTKQFSRYLLNNLQHKGNYFKPESLLYFQNPVYA